MIEKSRLVCSRDVAPLEARVSPRGTGRRRHAAKESYVFSGRAHHAVVAMPMIGFERGFAGRLFRSHAALRLVRRRIRLAFRT